jgi:GNAT superfamily N-acetyltransferase
MFTLRNAKPGDTAAICGFIRDLARYERLEHEVTATSEMIEAALFGPAPKAFALMGEVDSRPAGFALCFYNFSTFLGRAGIYIEDIYVDPAYRKHGIGRAILKALAQRAVAEGCGRVEWSVLNWNTPALDFYAGLGAKPMDEWQIQRLTGDALHALAA